MAYIKRPVFDYWKPYRKKVGWVVACQCSIIFPSLFFHRSVVAGKRGMSQKRRNQMVHLGMLSWLLVLSSLGVVCLHPSSLRVFLVFSHQTTLSFWYYTKSPLFFLIFKTWHNELFIPLNWINLLDLFIVARSVLQNLIRISMKKTYYI